MELGNGVGAILGKALDQSDVGDDDGTAEGIELESALCDSVGKLLGIVLRACDG